MSILITGGAGFIGSSLADFLLSKGSKVIVLDNFNDYYDPRLKEKNIAHNLSLPDYKLYRGDICDKKILKKIFAENEISAIAHIAASAGVRASIENPEIFIQSNIAGTLNVLEAMKNKGVKKLIFASSSSVYGNCKAKKFSELLKVTKPISPYAATKSSCEQLIYAYSNLLNQVCHLEIFHRLWSAPKTRFGDKEILGLDRSGQAHTRLRRRQNQKRLHLYRRYHRRHLCGSKL